MPLMSLTQLMMSLFSTSSANEVAGRQLKHSVYLNPRLQTQMIKSFPGGNFQHVSCFGTSVDINVYMNIFDLISHVPHIFIQNYPSALPVKWKRCECKCVSSTSCCPPPPRSASAHSCDVSQWVVRSNWAGSRLSYVMGLSALERPRSKDLQGLEAGSLMVGRFEFKWS